LVGGCRSASFTSFWPAPPRGVGLLEYRSKPAHHTYWVDDKQVGPDAEAAIAALQAHRHVTVAVYSEYKLADWGCELRAQLVMAHLEVVSFLEPSPVAPGWTDLNQQPVHCRDQTAQ